MLALVNTRAQAIEDGVLIDVSKMVNDYYNIYLLKSSSLTISVNLSFTYPLSIVS